MCICKSSLSVHVCLPALISACLCWPSLLGALITSSYASPSRLRTGALKRWQACRHTLAMTSCLDHTSRPLLCHRASVSLERPFTLGRWRSTRQPQSAWQGPVLWAANRLTVLVVIATRDTSRLCVWPPQRASNSARLLSRMLHTRTYISLYLLGHLHSRGEGPSFDLPMVRR